VGAAVDEQPSGNIQGKVREGRAMKYAAVIRDNMNIVIRVEERPTEERALKAARFFTNGRTGWWWTIAIGESEIEMFKALINV